MAEATASTEITVVLNEDEASALAELIGARDASLYDGLTELFDSLTYLGY